ncbi:MAG: DMT family transporter [Siculibacillus sp.]|nr:DMT family transporter [Siculibacillus sp.]
MTDATAHHHLWPGVPYALAAALLFAVVPPLSKLLVATVDPFMTAGLLYLGAGVGLAGLRLVPGALGREGALRRDDLPWLVGAVATGGVIAPVLLMIGLARTSASGGALLLNLEGLATMAIAWIVFRENVDRRLLIGAAAILSGAVLLTWDGGKVSLDSGALLIAGACLAWGIDNNLTRKVSAADPIVLTIVKGCAAGSVNIGIALASGASPPAGPVVLGAMVLGFFGIGSSLVLFILALRHLGTARTGAYFSLAPFIGAAISVAFLGEPVTLRLSIAAAAMAVGLWLHLAERHEHEHVHEPLEHDHLHHHDDHHSHSHDGPVDEPHSHPHRHAAIRHAHVHYPDLHHRHGHTP